MTSSTPYVAPKCNCPDYAAMQAQNLYSNSQSKQFNRDWSTKTNDTTGATSNFNGIANQGYYCKHIERVLTYTGQASQAYPDGRPYKPNIVPLAAESDAVAQPLQSDNLYFSPVGNLI
jgi:hypothetical protein